MPVLTESDIRQAYQLYTGRQPTRAEITQHLGQTVPDVAAAARAFFGAQPRAPAASAPPPAAPRAAAPKAATPIPTPTSGPSDDATRQAREAVWQQYRAILGRDPTGGELSAGVNDIVSGGRSYAQSGLRIAAEHQRELATGRQDATNQYQPGLSDAAQREAYRTLLLQFADKADEEAQARASQDFPTRPTPSLAQWRDTLSMRPDLQAVPVSFLNPNLTVRREQVDTEPEMADYLRRHGGDTPLNRQLLKAALDYGGLAIEPTPFGTQQRAGGGTEWYRPNGNPGALESRLGGRTNLTPAELSAIAQERQGAWRLRQAHPLEDTLSRAALAGIFATAGGLIAGPAVGGAAAGLGVPGTAATAGAGGTGLAGGVGAVGAGAVGGGVGGAVAGRGDPNAIWQGALGGALTGGLGYGLPGGATPATGALKGAGLGAAGNLAAQGLGGEDINWARLATALGSGAAAGAVSGLGPTGPAEGLGLSLAKGLGGAVLNAQSQGDPFAGANAQMDQAAVQREQALVTQMQAAQDEWKRRYAAAQADALGRAEGAQTEALRRWSAQAESAQAAQLAALRAAQQQQEAQSGAYAGRLQAFLAERQTQIEEALRAMGMAEPGIASLLADRQKALDAQRQQQDSEQAALVESRNYFPSQLLAQTGDTGASSLLVPHSPPPVLFGQEGMPASVGDYSQAPPPTFTAEGFLPSGALTAAAPPAVAPMGTPRLPRYFPTLLNGLTRSPYLRYA